MSNSETARVNYESARQEIMGRIQARDNIFLAFLTAVATLFGIALSTDPSKTEILLIVPYLTLGATLLIVQHHAAIAAIIKYINFELKPFLKGRGEFAPEYDTSSSKLEFVTRSVILRTAGHIILIILPSIASITMNWRHRSSLITQFGSLWLFGVITTLISLGYTLENLRKRMNLQKMMMFEEKIEDKVNLQMNSMDPDSQNIGSKDNHKEAKT